MPLRPYLQDPEWTWLLVIEMSLAAIAAGAYFAYGSIGIGGHKEDRPLVHRLGFVPLPLMLVVALLLIVDLGQPVRFVNLILTSASAVPERGGPLMLNLASPLSFGTYIITVFGFFTLVAFIDSLMHAGRLSTNARYEGIAHNTIFQAIGGFFALLTGSYSGVLINVTQQTVWTDSILHGAMYCAMAAFGGVGVAAILANWRGAAPGTVRALRDALLWTLVINVVLLVLLVINLNRFAQPLALSLTVGPVFWIGVVILGLAVPAWLLLMRRVTTPRDLAIVGWLAIVAVVSLRYSILFSAIAALRG
jgi:formate-dependent nitrite reductase membrane component NrfD